MKNTKLTILATKILGKNSLDEIKSPNLSIEMNSFIKIIPLYPKIEKIKSKNIIISSPNALYGLSSQAILRDKNIYCVGQKTKKVLEKFNLNVKIYSDNSDDLSNKLIGKIKDACLICSNIRLNTIPNKLIENNINIQEIQSYKTVLTPYQIDQSLFDAIIFFSPSGVKSFFELNSPDKTILYSSIGTTTAKQIKYYTKRNILVAENNNVKTIVSLIFDKLKK